MKKLIILLGICILSISGCNQKDPPKGSDLDEGTETVQEDYKVNESPDGSMQVFITHDHKVVLKNQEETKVIYEGYPDVETMDPYSIYSFDEYLISWSKNSKYLFIKDSIYDITKDELTSLKNNVVFYWKDNIGIFLAQGKDFQLGYDGAIHSEFAVGKKINAFVEGNIVEVKQAENDRYFILDPLYLFEETLIEDQINITTARLKHDIQALQQMMDKGEIHQLIRDAILVPKVKDELRADYTNLTDKIKNLDEYYHLKEKRKLVENKEGSIKVNSSINELLECILYEYASFNTRPDYFYQDVEVEKVELNKALGVDNQPSTPISIPLDKAIYKIIDKELEQSDVFKKLTSKIKKLEEFKILSDKITRYKSIAPVTFENIEKILNLVDDKDHLVWITYEDNRIPVIEATTIREADPLNGKMQESLSAMLNPAGAFEFTVKASSCLNSESKKYSTSKINDTRVDTAWVEGTVGNGIGESITLSFSQKSLNKQISSFSLINGYTKNEKIWNQNNRIKLLRVLVNGKNYCYIKLHDTHLLQNIHLPNDFPILEKDTLIKLILEEIYKGDQYEDTCITEFSVVGL